MKNYFLTHKYFYTIYACILCLWITLRLIYSKETLFFAVNGHYSYITDIFFFVVTEAGNTWTYIGLILLSLFLPRRYTIMLLIALLISSLAAQGLKHSLFENYLRPLAYFPDASLVHHLKWSQELRFHSMPSGHATSVFAWVTCTVLYLNRQKYDLLFLLLALLAAYSRVYLGQHFTGDVVAGSAIGIVSAHVAQYFTNQFESTTWFNIPFVQGWFGK